MISYKITKYIVRTEDGDTEFIKISGGVLHCDTQATFLLIICLGYLFKKALHRNNDIWFTPIGRMSKIYLAI